MTLTRQATWNRVALAAALVAAVAFVVVWFAVTNSRACTPEARDVAGAQDARLVLSGAITINEAVNRESARMERCGD